MVVVVVGRRGPCLGAFHHMCVLASGNGAAFDYQSGGIGIPIYSSGEQKSLTSDPLCCDSIPSNFSDCAHF